MRAPSLRIGACIMAHNMAPLIGACIRCLQWTDGIFLFDDKSTDGTADIAKSSAQCEFASERSKHGDVAFRVGELMVRNHAVAETFERLSADVVVIVDADELLSSLLRPEIERWFNDPASDSMAFPLWHLFDQSRYLHFWETAINGVKMVDPHTRVIRRSRRMFVPLFLDGSHPILAATVSTTCLNGPFHFHLKYHFRSKLPNYSLYFLPERITEANAAPLLRRLPFLLPEDVAAGLASIDWDRMPRYDSTPHYVGQARADIGEALIHPKDRLSQ